MQDENNNPAQLRRNLTTFNVWAMAFGGVIGWGSFVMPGTTFLPRAGVLGTIIAMEIAAFIMMIISYSYMIRKFPENSGQFIYAKKAFGETHGFICAWFLSLCYIMIIPMNATALCLVFRAVFGDILQFGFHYTIAGYDIYCGEVILALASLFVFACQSCGRSCCRKSAVRFCNSPFARSVHDLRRGYFPR